MSILDTILNRSGKSPIPVPTPEWPELDGRLAVCRLSAAARVALDVSLAQEEAAGGAAFMAAVAARCAILLPDGDTPQQPAFDAGDWKALVDDPGSGGAIERLFEAADEANCLSAAARGRLKKTSAAAAGSGDTSASPASSA